MIRHVAILALLVLVGCGKKSPTETPLPDGLMGTWEQEGAESYFRVLHITVTNSPEVSGTVYAELQCAPGATTFTPASSPAAWPCRLAGAIHRFTESDQSVTVDFSFTGAPVGATFSGTVTDARTIAGTLNVRANTERHLATVTLRR